MRIWQEILNRLGVAAPEVDVSLPMPVAAPVTMPVLHVPEETARLFVPMVQQPAAQRTKVRAVLTDFDGVIGDNDAAMCEAYAKLHAQHPSLPDSDVALTYATKPREFLKTFLNDHEKSELFKEGRQLYEATPMHALPGARETLQAYQAQGVPCAVVSNNTNTSNRWRELGLAEAHPATPVFDHAGKPDTRCLAQALNQLHQPPGRDVIMVDDNWKGLVAAAKLGLTPVLFGNKAHTVLPKVQKALQEENIPMPVIPIVRDNQELQQLLSNGMDLQRSASQRVA